MANNNSNRNGINVPQILAIIAALGIIAYASGISIGGFFQGGEKMYSIEGSAHIAGHLLEPNIDIQNLDYSVREAGLFDFNIASEQAMSLFDVAEDVSCRAILLNGASIVKSSGFKSMGNFGTFTDKDYTFTIAKVPSDIYTLRVECKWADGGYNKKEQAITVG